MDFASLNRGERIAGVAGVLLILIMFIFDWFGPKGGTDLGGTNAWQSYGFTDIILFITALVAVALAVTAASDGELGLPVALSAIVTALGIISVILVIISIISPPDYDVPGVLGGGGQIDTSVEVGVFLGLIAALGATAGGWLAMQEEGTSFAGEADRFRGGGIGGPGAGPPPPPPPPSSPPPPPSSPPPGSNPPPPSAGP
jgi:hypothetical protein